MGTVVTVVPTSIISDPSPLTIGGGAPTKWQAISDSSDATYLSSIHTLGPSLVVDMANPTIPTGAIVEWIKLRVRALSNDSVTFLAADQITTVKKGTSSPLLVRGGILESYALDNAIHNGESGQYDRTSDGTLFDDCDLTNLWLSIKGYSGGVAAGTQLLYQVEADISYNSRPVVTLGAIPTGSSLPTIPWTFTDTDGDPQVAYRLMVFSENAYSVTGTSPGRPGGPPLTITAGAGTSNFVPENATTRSGLVYDSGKVISSALSKKITTGLTNGSKYWFYVKIWQPNVVGKEQTSAWAASSLTTVTVTPPTAPVATATASSSKAAVTLDVQQASTATPHPTYYDIERSTDGQVSWSPVRYAKQAGTSVGYRFLGVAANTLTAPKLGKDVPATLFTLDVLATLTDWSPASTSGIRSLVELGTATGNDRGFVFGVDPSGNLILKYATTVGTAYATTCTSTAPVPFADGTPGWVRVVFAPAFAVVQFWTSTDGVTWTQLGANISVAGTGGRTPTAGWTIGQADADANTQLTGLVSIVRWSNAFGIQQLNLDLTGQDYSTSALVEQYGSAFTVNTTGASGSYWQAGLTIDDNELTPGVPARYRFRSWRDDTEQSTGAWVIGGADVTIPVTTTRLKDPLYPTLNTVISAMQLDRERPNPQNVTYGLDAGKAAVQSAGLRGSIVSARLWTKSKAEYDALLALLATGRILLLQGTLLEQWYVKVGDRVSLGPVRAQPTASEITPTRHLHSIDVSFTEVEAPL